MTEASANERIRTFLTVMPRLLRPERPPAAALRDISDAARTLFGVRYSGAALIEDDGSLGAVAFSGVPPEAVRAMHAGPDVHRLFRSLDASGFVRAMEPTTGSTIDLPDEHPPVRHLLGAPLRAHDRSVGLIYLGDREDGEPFTAEDRELADAAGGLLGAAIANAQLLRDALHARSWMRAATGITQELFAGELKQPLQQIADRVHQLADADLVGLAVLEDDMLVIRHATGPDLDPLSVVGRELPLAQTTFAKRIIRNGRGHVFAAVDAPIRDLLLGWTGIEIGPAMMLPLRGTQGILGLMFVGRKLGSWRFTETDVEIGGTFANHAAVALELANTRQVAEHLKLLEERNRIGRDLHDHVVQRLYGTGMSLQHVVKTLEGVPLERVSSAISTLDDTIRQIRNTIMSLHNPDEETTFESLVGDIAREAAPLLGFNPMVTLEAPAGELVGPLAADLAACVREGMSNIVRHAKADRVEIHGSVDGAALLLTLEDDGVGIQSTRRSGLDNMGSRVRRHGGHLEVRSEPDQGTQLCWRVPLPRASVPRPRQPTNSRPSR